MANLEMSSIGPSLGTSSSGVYNVETGVSWRKLKIGCSSFCLLFGAILIAIAAFVPSVVNNSISNGVQDTARLDPEKMTDSQMAKFVNGTTNEAFYLFTITNLADVLNNGAKINYKEIGPINTKRHGYRYNITWDTANSKVSHKWLTTFEVLDDSQELLDVPIIGVNPFYLGAAAAVMRTVVATGAGQNPSDPASFRPTAQFPYLSDAYFQALFISGKLLTGILPVFSNPAGPFLTKTRASSVSSYAQFVPKFCQKAGLDFASAKIAWASATPYLSAAVPSYFTGFELPVALQSTNLTAVSDAVFDPLNQYSIASAAGLATWYCILIPSQCTLVPSPLYADVAAALFIDNPNADLPTISKWIGSLAQALPLAPNDVGSAYQKTVCAAISGQVQALRAAATVFSGIVANASEWSPSNWAEVGAMQFGSGFVVGSTISVPNLLQGIGVSVADLPSAKPADPLNFGDGNQLKEPIEFAGGLRYYIATNAPSAARPVNPKWPAGAQLAPLWQYNPALLYAYDVTTGATSTTAQITLNVKESAALIQLLLADTKIYGGLIQQLAPLVQAYAFVFQSCLQTQGPGQLQTCINQATGAVASQYDTLFPSAATSLYVFPPGNFAAGQVIVTKTNFFAIYVYLHQYLGHTFTGTLAEIDPVHGVGVQNSGLFTKRTVREMLFGYTNRYGQQIPPIAGPLLDASTFQKVLDQDYLDHQGRDYVQDTGHRDINTVGQWIQFEGVAKYQTHCDIDDPARTGSCSPAGSLQEAGNNWQVWGAPAVLAGSGSSLQIAPFGEDEVVEKTAFYVSEIRRPVVVEYKSDVTVKGIDLRRYGLWQALSNASFVTPNTEKNQEQWFQGGVPDGLYSMKTYQGGFSAMVSIPHFGDTDPKVWQGCTCDSGDCAQWYNDDLHATTIDIHPLTGLTMQGHKRLQANFKIDAHEFFTGTTTSGIVGSGFNCQCSTRTSWKPARVCMEHLLMLTSLARLLYFLGCSAYYNNLFANTDTLYIPYYWADINDVITDDDAEKVRSSEKFIALARSARKVVPIVFFIFGPIIFILSLLGIIYYCKAAPKGTS